MLVNTTKSVKLKTMTKVRSLFLLLSPLPWLWILQVDIGPRKLVVLSMKVFVFLVLSFITFGFTYLSFTRLLKPRLSKPSWHNLAQLIVIWAFLELALSWLLAIIWYDGNGSWDTTLPFISTTPLVMFTPLRFLSRAFGYYGTSAIFAVGVLIIFYHRTWHKITVAYWMTISVFSVILFLIYLQPNGKKETVTIVAEARSEQSTIRVNRSDFVLLPEYGLDGANKKATQLIQARGKEIYFSGSRHSDNPKENHNILIYGSTNHGTLAQSTKTRLIPGGEYLPSLLSFFYSKTNPDSYIRFSQENAVSRGNEHQAKPFYLPSGTAIGNAVCSSIISSRDYQQLTSRGATILGNSASLAAFNNSRWLRVYFDSYARFAATANARPFIQSARSWNAYALNHNGDKIADISPASYREVTVQTNNRKTPYTYVGEWLSVLGGVYLIYAGTLSAINLQRRKPSENRSKHLR